MKTYEVITSRKAFFVAAKSKADLKSSIIFSVIQRNSGVVKSINLRTDIDSTTCIYSTI
jgi:hypothetical protein